MFIINIIEFLILEINAKNMVVGANHHWCCSRNQDAVVKRHLQYPEKARCKTMTRWRIVARGDGEGERGREWQELWGVRASCGNPCRGLYRQKMWCLRWGNALQIVPLQCHKVTSSKSWNCNSTATVNRRNELFKKNSSTWWSPKLQELGSVLSSAIHHRSCNCNLVHAPPCFGRIITHSADTLRLGYGGCNICLSTPWNNFTSARYSTSYG